MFMSIIKSYKTFYGLPNCIISKVPCDDKYFNCPKFKKETKIIFLYNIHPRV